MSKVRVYELAKQLGVENKDLLKVIAGLGIEVKNHMSAVDEAAAAKIIAAAKPPAPKKAEAGRKAAPASKKESVKGGSAQPGERAKPSPATHAPKAAKPAGKAAAAPAEPKAPVAHRVPAAAAAPPAPAIEKPQPPPPPAALPAAILEPPPAPPAAPMQILISEGITVKDLADKVGVKVNDIIKRMMSKQRMYTVNQFLDFDSASDVAKEFGVLVQKVSLEEEGLPADVETGALVHRAPVVTIMGHVDHGKTSLLDAIRSTSVTEKEKGGITQHIGAYHVVSPRGSIVFLDTPGHEAFTAMRARGAQVTDIVVLVVAADDGVMPQTVEALDHAKAAGVPIIVAVNKIDKPGANPQQVLTQLAERGLIPEAWGGQTIYVEVSAKKRIGLEDLLEMILLQAEVLELKANPNKPCRGTIIESKLDRGRGPVATVLVQDGTLRIGDYFVTGVQSGKVRAIYNEAGESLREAPPSTPVEVLGLSGIPAPGESFQVVSDERKGRQIIAMREQKSRGEAVSRPRLNLQDFFSRVKDGEAKELLIVLKGDVQGSVEALSDALVKLSGAQVKVRVIHKGVGTINEGDILLAAASNAVVIGFNVRPEPKVAAIAAHEQVDMRFYGIIYQVTEDIKKAMTGLLAPTFKEEVQGRAEVRQLFQVPKVGTIAGCGVLEGKITRSSEVRVIREGIVIYTGKISSLRRIKDDAREVAAGYECGIGVENYNDLRQGDILEAFTQVKVAGTLS
jgi:translation initiation factor IF-2